MKEAELKTLVKKKMIKKGMSNYRLAQDSGVSEGSLSRWFSSGRSLALETFLKIARIVGIQIK